MQAEATTTGGMGGMGDMSAGGAPMRGERSISTEASLAGFAAAFPDQAAAAFPASGLPASGAVLAGTVLGLAVGFTCGCGWGLLLGSSAPKATAALGRGLTRLATVAAEAHYEPPSSGYALRARRRRE